MGSCNSKESVADKHSGNPTLPPTTIHVHAGNHSFNLNGPVNLVYAAGGSGREVSVISSNQLELQAENEQLREELRQKEQQLKLAKKSFRKKTADVKQQQ